MEFPVWANRASRSDDIREAIALVPLEAANATDQVFAETDSTSINVTEFNRVAWFHKFCYPSRPAT